ncbi:aaa family ATPase [Grosmannia clavigera kw1407]|uniref:Aaa family ATPase n=1 Tax=Grosmannia clavigera (strain kw1407 / UAMH 11150) TaxID=655863 RepID=F0X7W2_GROCL|nr:aaa family ATPase [Grosmannia clavigera kw1407]EFX06502.1 aaa family ATPase [Grosmannia clavigera kw1407]
MFPFQPGAPSSQGQPSQSSAPVFRSLGSASVVDCPICGMHVRSIEINAHLDAGCVTHTIEKSPANTFSTNRATAGPKRPTPPPSSPASSSQKRAASSFFQAPMAKRQTTADGAGDINSKSGPQITIQQQHASSKAHTAGVKRSFDEGPGYGSSVDTANGTSNDTPASARGQSELPKAANDAYIMAAQGPAAKRSRINRAAPLAERMRPQDLDDVFGQELVGPNGVLRALIEADRVPSMILWGGSGTGKTTIARCIAQQVGSRFVEMNATNSGGISECKKLFQDASNELALTGRKTILFCDEIHRFTKAQQDVFLKPVEAGTITLIGATTENPSFRIVTALLSRCRTFTLAPLATEDVRCILERAVLQETGIPASDNNQGSPNETDISEETKKLTFALSPLIDRELLGYLAAFADGDARAALNLLELAMSIAARPREVDKNTGKITLCTKEDLKSALTKTLVYDRAGDQHYDTISAFHKSVRGSDPDATLYYLARMLQSGEDPLFIARRMVVIASEDVGLADSTLLSLATSAYTATQQIGMPEARIPLAHCAVALALAPKSTRAYRGLNNAYAALREPGVASLPIPVHLRNAPTRLMKDMGYGKEYKYNPNYLDGRVKQDYLPDQLLDRTFLETRDLGTAIDPDLE